jgi:hypothetical protein
VIRGNLEDMYGLSPEEWQKITGYTEQLHARLVQVALSACENLQPVTLYRGTGEAGFAINRRQYTLDGVALGTNPIGPVDNDVPVLKVVNEQDETIAAVFGYACHNTTLDGFEYCGDYAGFAQEYLEQDRPGTVALFFSGCGGDINPHPRREVAMAQAHGRQLAAAVEKVLSQPMQKLEGTRIQHSFAEIPLPLTAAPSCGELTQQTQN